MRGTMTASGGEEVERAEGVIHPNRVIATLGRGEWMPTAVSSIGRSRSSARRCFQLDPGRRLRVVSPRRMPRAAPLSSGQAYLYRDRVRGAGWAALVAVVGMLAACGGDPGAGDERTGRLEGTVIISG